MGHCKICNSLTENVESVFICKLCKIDRNYKLAYDLLMEYWDCIPEEDKKDLDKKLKSLGL